MSNNVLACFDGHGRGRIAFEVLGITPGKYYSSEVDKYAIEGSMAVFPDTIQLGDITRWREWTIDWCSLDWFIGGSPCQGFSMAGKMAGTAAILNGEKIVVDSREKYLELKLAKAEFLSQSYLFWEYILCLDFVKMCNPKIKFFLENVKMKKEFLDLISNAIGVEPVFINSALVSAQNRQRFYWCNWGVEQPKDKGIVLADILEGGEACDLMTTKQDKSFVLTASYNGAVAWNSIERKQKTMIKEHDISETCYGNYLEVKCAAQRGRYNDNGKALCLTANYYKGVDADSRPMVATTDAIEKEFKECLKNVHYRKLTPRECGRLQTIPEDILDTLLSAGISNSQLYKMFGNGWTIDVIAHIFKQGIEQ
jgi:site-specific DNA-cytosine methylase